MAAFNPTDFQFNDGGRSDAGFKGRVGDCVCRAIAIATGLPYRDVYKELRRRSGRSPRYGVFTRDPWFKVFMAELGFEWVATMKIGTGTRVHLNAAELPRGRIIVRVSRHYSAVINGIINDTYDPSRNGERCVYGYWILKADTKAFAAQI